MPESVQIILGIMFLVAVFVLTRMGIAWKLSRSAGLIIKDLRAKGAVDPVTAVDLPYAKSSPLRIGMRDYFPKALEQMVVDGVVAKTVSNKYYLTVRPLESDDHSPEGP
jgi:hypothetical protein